MNIIDKSEAERILKPHLNIFDRVFENAFSRYLQVKDRFDHTSRTRASLIHDYIKANAEKEFEGLAGINLENDNKLFTVCFHDKLKIRFKKLDNRLRAANIPTQQALSFEKKMTLMTLPGFPVRPTYLNLTAGYMPDNTWTEIIKKTITCFDEDGLQWEIPIATHPDAISLPLTNQPTTSSTPKTNRWKLKSPKTKEVNNGPGSKL